MTGRRHLRALAGTLGALIGLCACSAAPPAAESVARSADVELKLAPPAAEVPPHLFVDDVEVAWFTLDWHSDSVSSSIAPDITTVPSHEIPAGLLRLALSPAVSPLALEVLLYEGEVDTPEPTSDPYLTLDCLASDDPCRWTGQQGMTEFSIEGIRPGPQVVVVQSRFFAPPESNPDRVSNEATWVFELS